MRPLHSKKVCSLLVLEGFHSASTVSQHSNVPLPSLTEPPTSCALAALSIAHSAPKLRAPLHGHAHQRVVVAERYSATLSVFVPSAKHCCCSQLIIFNCAEQLLVCATEQRYFVWLLRQLIFGKQRLLSSTETSKQCGAIVSQLLWQWRHLWFNPLFCWPVLYLYTPLKTMCRLKLFQVVLRDCQISIGTHLIQCK